MTLLINIPKSCEPLVFPLTLIPKPAFSESCTGILNVNISLCFHGNVELSSVLSCGYKIEINKICDNLNGRY